MFDFQKIWRVLFSCNTGFENHPFALLPKNYAKSSSSFERHGLINFIFYFNIWGNIVIFVATILAINAFTQFCVIHVIFNALKRLVTVSTFKYWVRHRNIQHHSRAINIIFSLNLHPKLGFRIVNDNMWHDCKIMNYNVHVISFVLRYSMSLVVSQTQIVTLKTSTIEKMIHLWLKRVYYCKILT